MRATANTVLAINDLIRIPVQVCKATEQIDVRLNLAGPEGQKVSQRYVDADDTLIPADELQRGIFDGDDFKPVPKDAIDAINAATKIEEMAVSGQMPIADVPFDRVTGSYFLQSPTKGGSHKAYRLIYEALLADDLAITTKWTARSRQQLAVIYADADKGCMVMNTLTFADEQRAADAAILAPQSAEVADEQVGLARQLLSTMPEGAEALATDTDVAIAMKRDLIDKALAGETVSAPAQTAKKDTADNDLTALLAASVKTAKKPAAKKKVAA